MNISPDTFVKEVVRKNFKTASLFQANNIDFCCGGNRPISEACTEVGINPDKLILQLETVVAHKDPDSEYIESLSLTELADYIIKRHHAYVRDNIPFLTRNLEKICQVHGQRHPELFSVRDLFLASAGDLTMHMQKEEIMLFPFIKRLESGKSEGELPQAHFGSVSNPIRMMLADHQNEGDRFVEISRLTDNYQTPHDGCTTYDVTLQQLRDYENDLHRHIHLENNVLFPKAIELENELKA